MCATIAWHFYFVFITVCATILQLDIELCLKQVIGQSHTVFLTPVVFLVGADVDRPGEFIR